MELYIPRDKESEKPKGFAFAEYESEEIADYAIKLFSGLVTLYKRTLKFAVCSLLPVDTWIYVSLFAFFEFVIVDGNLRKTLLSYEIIVLAIAECITQSHRLVC